jgi:hypothetical protein
MSARSVDHTTRLKTYKLGLCGLTMNGYHLHLRVVGIEPYFFEL